MENCMCIQEVKEILKGFNGNGIRILEKDYESNSIVISDLYLDGDNVLSLDQYDNVSIDSLNNEEEVIEALDNAKLWVFKENHDLGELQIMANAIINEFNFKKLVEMPIYETEIEFLKLSLNNIAYLAPLS